MVNGHSFIPNIYIAPLQETYTEPLSDQLRPKRNVLRSLQKEDTLSRGSKRSVLGIFQVAGSNNRESSKRLKRRADQRNQELTTSRRTKLDGKLNPKPAYSDQSSKMGHNQLQIARKVMKPYIKCVGRQEVSTGHRACKQKPRHI